MNGLIFSAGLGTRLKPLTDMMPKALVPLAGKPLLQWQVEKLRDAGITDIIVNVHHFPDMIIDTIRRNNGWGCHITVSDERDQLLDTGGGLRKILPSLQGGDGGRLPILACNVDILSNIDIPVLIDRYEQTGLSQLVVSDRKTQRYLLFDEENMLRGWTNISTGEVKPANLQSPISNLQLLAFSGMQILTPEVLSRLDEMEESKFSLIDFYLHLCDSNRTPYTVHSTPYTVHPTPLQAFVPKNYKMMDVGKIDEIEKAERFAALLVSPERLELSTH